MAQNSEVKKLIIPYFISLGFVAVSINSLARGIDNHETWRIVVASIGGSFFLGVAIVAAIKLIRILTSSRRKRRVLGEKIELPATLKYPEQIRHSKKQ